MFPPQGAPASSPNVCHSPLSFLSRLPLLPLSVPLWSCVPFGISTGDRRTAGMMFAWWPLMVTPTLAHDRGCPPTGGSGEMLWATPGKTAQSTFTSASVVRFWHLCGGAFLFPPISVPASFIFPTRRSLLLPLLTVARPVAPSRLCSCAAKPTFWLPARLVYGRPLLPGGIHRVALPAFFPSLINLSFQASAPPEHERAARDRAARRRLRASMGSFSSHLVSPTIFRRYCMAFLSFLSFSRRAWHRLPSSPPQLDECLAAFVEPHGYPQAGAVYALSGVAFFTLALVPSSMCFSIAVAVFRVVHRFPSFVNSFDFRG